MNRKQYELIANEILTASCRAGVECKPETYNYVTHVCLKRLSNALAIRFAEDNPKFKEELFLERAGYPL